MLAEIIGMEKHYKDAKATIFTYCIRDYSNVPMNPKKLPETTRYYKRAELTPEQFEALKGIVRQLNNTIDDYIKEAEKK